VVYGWSAAEKSIQELTSVNHLGDRGGLDAPRCRGNSLIAALLNGDDVSTCRSLVEHADWRTCFKERLSVTACILPHTVYAVSHKNVTLLFLQQLYPPWTDFNHSFTAAFIEELRKKTN